MPKEYNRGGDRMKHILHLRVKKEWFGLISSGEKTEEFRLDTSYWRKRLAGKTFEEVHFTNGYGGWRPFARVECLGIKEGNVPYCWDDRVVGQQFRPGFIISLGAVREVRNWAGE